MRTRIVQILSAAVLAVGLVAVLPAAADTASGDGIVRVRSAYPLDETVVRLKQDIAGGQGPGGHQHQRAEGETARQEDHAESGSGRVLHGNHFLPGR